MPSDHGSVQIETRHDLFPVELLDHQFRRVARGYGRLEAEVPPGIYLARCEAGGPAVEQLVKVAAGQSIKVPFTDTNIYTQRSAAPVPGSISRHEFYTYPVHDLTQRQVAHRSLGSGARLVLFATQLDFAENQDWEKGARPVHWKGTKLRDSQGKVLFELPGHEACDADDRRHGRAGFCADLNPGGYFLEWPPDTSEDRLVLQPLWLAQDWTTQLFAGASGDDPRPQRDTASIHMVRLGVSAPAYDPEIDRLNGAAELALASLRTGRRQLGDDHLRTLLHGKFENPMLGLLGAHMLLQRADLNRPLLDQVFGNLRGLIGRHPDLWALEILARSRFQHTLPAGSGIPAEVNFPPMLREGLMALAAAQWNEKQPLKLTATANLARLRLLAEGPWTLFWHAEPEAESPSAVPRSLSTGAAPIAEFFGGLAGRLLSPRHATATSLDLPGALRGVIRHALEERGSSEDFGGAETEAKLGALEELADYLRNLRERRGIPALRSMRAEHLQWTGLSPTDADAVLDAVRAVFRDLGDLDGTRFCDMVMKGGITSGVVYPLAIAKLSERFRFKNIGGTSAGAIAAAAAAAAELARDSGGFERLKGLPAFLSSNAPDGSGSNLSAFFQPQPQTSRIFRIGMAALGGGAGAVFRVLGRALSEYAVSTMAGAAPGAAFLILACLSARGPLLVACVLAAVVLMLIGVTLSVAATFILDLVRGLPKNFYGLCSGMSSDFFDVQNAPPSGRGRPLTYWLTEYLNGFINRRPSDPPLTFGDLWGSSDPQAERRVNLEMMTTCLTHGRPYRLPFRDDEDVHENRLFYFRRDEFERLFPKSVVKWMIENPRPVRRQTEVEQGKALAERAALANKGFFPLPDPAKFPVVVAVRMSLSFPILLSAIPLHAVDRSRDPEGQRPERCWFSDGGVCSNFPIHFFDSPLPRWPTLSINLVEKPTGTSPEALLQPEMPTGNGGFIQENWNRFETFEELDSAGARLLSKEKSGLGKLLSFAGAFITTMQNWSDNTQSRLPGYRDRIAQVGLTPEEGGLNLDMPPDRIKDLTDRGGAAGEEFIARFGVPPTHPQMHWANHRWLRMRSCLASLESLLAGIERGCAGAQPQDVDYETWVRTTPPKSGAPSYDWGSVAQHELAKRTIRELRELVADQATSGELLADRAPRPRPELRPRPRL